MTSSRIRVMVVDDSAYNRRVIKEMLSTSKKVEVVASARNGEDALKKLYEFRPDLITLDLEMPGMDGFTFLRLVMESKPLPVIVVSSRTEDKAIFRALELGATDFIAKPSVRVSDEIKRIEQELVWKVENIAQVELAKLVQLEGGALAETLPEEGKAPEGAPPECILLGSSTGGPAAIYYVLAHLAPTFTTPIAIAQHMPKGFTRPFAERLARRTGRDAREAGDGDLLTKGCILLAPGGKHMVIEQSRRGPVTVILEPDHKDRFVPSVDKLLASGADVYGTSAYGVVLTGMGNDGVKGAGAIRKAGGFVIAESEETAIVYGMPREVVEAGYATEVVPLSAIPRLLSRVAGKGAAGRQRGSGGA